MLEVYHSREIMVITLGSLFAFDPQAVQYS